MSSVPYSVLLFALLLDIVWLSRCVEIDEYLKRLEKLPYFIYTMSFFDDSFYGMQQSSETGCFPGVTDQESKSLLSVDM